MKMKSSLIAILATAVMLSALCIPADKLFAAEPDGIDIPREKLYLFLLIGQSNMAGRAPIEKTDERVIERCWLFNDSGEWEAAKNPLNRYSRYRKDISMQRLNPGYGFAKKLLSARPSIHVGLIVSARGGTSIAQWEQGGNLYTEALVQTRKAMKTGVLKGILWHQGEADKDDPEYSGKITELISKLRSDLGIPELPFVAGQIRKDKDYPVNEQIARLPVTVPFTGFVGSDGLTTIDQWHFDNGSMKLLGERYADEMLKLIQ